MRQRGGFTLHEMMLVLAVLVVIAAQGDVMAATGDMQAWAMRRRVSDSQDL